MNIRRQSACLIVEVMIDAEPRWSAGPLQLEACSPEIRRTPLVESTDATRRLSYFEPRVGEALYGSPSRPTRWHKPSIGTISGSEIFGLEIVRIPAAGVPGTGLAVVHITLLGEPRHALAKAAEISHTRAAGIVNRQSISDLLPIGTRLADNQRRAQTIAHVTFTIGPLPVMGDDYRSWPALDQWLWQLAAATPVEKFPPDLQDDGLFSGRVRFSRDWQALVLRDGVAFVGSTADPGDESTFHASAEVYVHTLYLDVFLLGRMQRVVLNSLANEISTIRPHQMEAELLAELELRLAEIRLVLWLNHITLQGKGNELLENYQRQNRLEVLHGRIVSDLENAARLVNALTNRRLSAVLGLLSVVGLPLATVYSAGQIWISASPLALVIWTTVAIFAAALVVGLIPAVRDIARSIHWLPQSLRRRRRTGTSGQNDRT